MTKPVLYLAALLCAIPVTFMPHNVMAEDTLQAADVFVTASGYEQDVKDAPASVTVITKEELEKKSATSLTEALRGVQGLDIIGGETGSISIRGMESDKVLIMVDGRRQNGTGNTRKGGLSQGQGNNWIPPVEAIERIEIVRGPMSTLYGSEAIGGVINVITKKTGKTWTGTFSTSATLRDNDMGDTLGGDVYVSGPIIDNKLGLQLWGNLSDRQEDEVLEGTGRSKKENGTARLWYTPWENQEFMLGISRQSQLFRTSPGKVQAESGTVKETEFDRTQYDFAYNGKVFGGTLSVDAFREEYTTAFSSSTGQVDIANNNLEAKYNIAIGNHILLMGGAYKKYELDDDGYYTTIVPGGTNIKQTEAGMEEYSLFLEDEWWLLDNLSLTAGLRYDNNTEFGDHWSPRVYGVWNFLSDWTLKGGVAWGFKSPTLVQINPMFGMSQRGGSITRGNPDLDPETSVNYELGLLYDNSRLSGSVTAFYTDYKDKIVNTGTNGLLDAEGNVIIDPLTGVGLSTYYNITGAEVYGLEFALAYKFTDTLTAKANYTYNHSEITGKASNLPYEFHKYDGLNGQPLVAMPKHLANLTLEWLPLENLSTFATLQYRGKEYYPNFGQGGSLNYNEDTTLTTDIGATWEPSKGLKLSAVVYNLFNDMRDKDDATYTYADSGRRFWFKISKTF